MSNTSRMISTNNLSQLSLLPADDTEEPISHISHISNMSLYDSIELHNTEYTLPVKSLDISYEEEIYYTLPPLPVSPVGPHIKKLKSEQEIEQQKKNLNSINLGDGKMDYIQNNHDKLMLTNAWQAITQTNTWNFVAQEIDSFMWSNDPRIHKITIKMEELGYDGHSGCSFGYTMRNMQYLAQKGEDNFKKLFEKEIKYTDTIITTNKINKFLNYTGGY